MEPLGCKQAGKKHMSKRPNQKKMLSDPQKCWLSDPFPNMGFDVALREGTSLRVLSLKTRSLEPTDLCWSSPEMGIAEIERYCTVRYIE